MRDVFLGEFRQLMTRLGGLRGLLTLAGLTMLASLIPMRAGRGFLDPFYLVAYGCFAVLFASSFAAQSFAGQREREFLENRGPLDVSDRDAVTGKVAAAAVWGWCCWALVLGVSLATLNATTSRLLLPPWVLLFALAVFAAALASLTSSIGAIIGLTVFTPQAARQLMRLGFFFVLLLLIALPRLLPDDIREILHGLLHRDTVVVTLLGASAVFVALSLLFLRRAVHILGEKRAGLSILA